MDGPVKIDLFPEGGRRELQPPWEPRPDTLAAIDGHFWDWQSVARQQISPTRDRHGGSGAGQDAVVPSGATGRGASAWEPRRGGCGLPDRQEGSLAAIRDTRRRRTPAPGHRRPPAIPTGLVAAPEARRRRSVCSPTGRRTAAVTGSARHDPATTSAEASPGTIILIHSVPAAAAWTSGATLSSMPSRGSVLKRCLLAQRLELHDRGFHVAEGGHVAGR